MKRLIIIRAIIGVGLAILSITILKALVASDMGQGAAVLFMLLSMALIAAAVRMPLPATARVEKQSSR